MTDYTILVRNMATEELRILNVRSISHQDAHAQAVIHAFRRHGWNRSETVAVEIEDVPADDQEVQRKG